MKKFIYGLFAGCMLLTSCSQDDLGLKAPGEEANVTITLTTPQMGTRAYSDGTTATVLKYAVYEVTGDGTSKSLTLLPNYTNENDQINLTKSLSFKFVTGKTYGIVFFAESPNSPYTVTFGNNGANMTVTGTLKANDENMDAFYKYLEFTATGDQPLTAELRRPFAQINYGTNDMVEAAAVNATPTQSRIIMTGVYSGLDLVTGECTGNSAQVTYAWNYIPSDETFPVDGYEYLAMAYALVPADQELVTVALQHNQPNNSAARTLYQVPVQRNYRTNIYGQALTSTTDLNIIIVPEYNTPDYNVGDIVLAAANGENISLSENTNLDQMATFSKAGSSYINLNGYTLDMSSNGGFGQIYVRGTNAVTLDINGPGTITQNGKDAAGSTSIIYLNNPNATININGGTYTSTGVETFYIGANGGTINITGGYFACSPYDGKYYTLNVSDGSNGKFVVTGGTFENFDPSNSQAESPAANWVAEGYHVVTSQKDGNTLYTVVPNDVKVAASTSDDLINAINNGDGVVLMEDITIPAGSVSSGYGSGSTGLYIKNGQTLDGNGHTLSVPGANNSTWSSAILTSGGTIKNITIASGFRGIFITSGANASKVILDNVTINGPTYTISCDSGSNQGLEATNCTFNGWTSYAAALGTATFNTCNFGQGAGYAFFRPFAPTTLNNCAFAKGFEADLRAATTFNGCTLGGVALTSSNITNLVTANSQYATVK